MEWLVGSSGRGMSSYEFWLRCQSDFVALDRGAGAGLTATCCVPDAAAVDAHIQEASSSFALSNWVLSGASDAVMDRFRLLATACAVVSGVVDEDVSDVAAVEAWLSSLSVVDAPMVSGSITSVCRWSSRLAYLLSSGIDLREALKPKLPA